MAKKSASQDFLDAHQYAINSVRRYERIFGKHFISTGGLESTEQITSLLNLKPGMKVLDVGCGIGGSLFYMAQTYAIEGHGIDLSKNMLGIAKDSLKSEYIPPSGKLTFELCNAEEKEFPEATFDVIYSRDAILHIYNKLSLFKKFYKWLKPGGKLLITDYNHGPVDKHSSEFKEYIKQRDYHLLTVPEYGETIRRAGFVDVQVQDKTDEFVRILKRELSDFYPQREAFIKEFTEKDYKDIVEGWETKIVRCAKGDQKWGLYFARKPCASSSSSCNSNCDNYSCNSTNNNNNNNSCNKNNSCSKL